MLAAILPCYKVRDFVLPVIQQIGPMVDAIYVVDDACPEKTGEYVRQNCRDPRVRVVTNEKNMGVGGATLAGFKKALEDGATLLVKLDGDGQMDPSFIPHLVTPLQEGTADYAKGNRFFSLEYLKTMPRIRLFGNSVLSFFTKLSSGYWRIMDPTNGYIAINSSVFDLLPQEKIERRYFFESDMLFRLNIIRAVVVDVPMAAKYGSEPSSLRVFSSIFSFSWKHTVRALKRVFYNYFLRDFSQGSLQLIFSFFFIGAGTSFGTWQWVMAHRERRLATSGTVMLAALPIIIGFQCFLAFLNYDVVNEPTRPIHRWL